MPLFSAYGSLVVLKVNGFGVGAFEYFKCAGVLAGYGITMCKIKILKKLGKYETQKIER